MEVLSMPAGTFVGMIIFAKNIDKTIPLGKSAVEIKEELDKLRVGNEQSVKGGGGMHWMKRKQH